MKKILFGILPVILFLCFLFSGCQAVSQKASDSLKSKCDDLLSYFDEIAIFPSNSIGESGFIARWETAIKVKVTGAYTKEDYSALTDLIKSLNSLGQLPEITFDDKDPNCFVYFGPLNKLNEAVPYYYKDDDWWPIYRYWNQYTINKAYIGIASDVSTQRQRNYMILLSLTKIIGFYNISAKYTDSIFYSKWSDIQSVSDMDYDLIRMLYCTSLSPGMDKQETDKVLGPWIKDKYLKEGYLK